MLTAVGDTVRWPHPLNDQTRTHVPQNNKNIGTKPCQPQTTRLTVSLRTSQMYEYFTVPCKLPVLPVNTSYHEGHKGNSTVRKIFLQMIRKQ